MRYPSVRLWLGMNRPWMRRTAYRPDAKGEGLPEGLSLLEMMMVVTLILIIASIATPFFRTAVVRAREAVLADHLYTLRYLIDRFTVDNGRSPAHLDEIVGKGYLGRLPTDPFTGSNETWRVAHTLRAFASRCMRPRQVPCGEDINRPPYAPEGQPECPLRRGLLAPRDDDGGDADLDHRLHRYAHLQERVAQRWAPFALLCGF